MAKITVQNTDISVVKYNEEDYISLTDMARSQLQDEHGNIFAKMNTSAFIVEDKIHAIYENGKLYFQSYTIANQIFSLIDFVTEATNTEIESFGEIKRYRCKCREYKTYRKHKNSSTHKIII